MTSRPVSIARLNQKRREAVKLRLDGHTLASVSQTVGLSAPTIVSAVKAWRDGGWPAVDVKPRGRPSRASGSDSAGLAALDDRLKTAMLTADSGASPLWSAVRVREWLETTAAVPLSSQRVAHYLRLWNLHVDNRHRLIRSSTLARHMEWYSSAYRVFSDQARGQRQAIYWIDSRSLADGKALLHAHDLRGRACWMLCATQPEAADYRRFLDALTDASSKTLALVLPARHTAENPRIARWLGAHNTSWIVAPVVDDTHCHSPPNTPPAPRGLVMSKKTAAAAADSVAPTAATTAPASTGATASSSGNSTPSPVTLTHLQRLEAESLHIMREVVAEAENPVMLYSIGKDSAVMLHLARKAFFPGQLPFPLLHVDTTWKFRAMYEFRAQMAKDVGFELLTHTNPEGLAQGVNPFTHGSALHTDIMKTEALKQALDQHRFDVAFGGARRDEEKSRAKERVFSFRSAQHRWEPKNQRPELWKLYNARKQPGESIRVFPLSNWTELDIWQYIHQQNIPLVPLYYAAERPVVDRDGTLIMVDDERMPLREGEVPMMRKVRFRTLGCYPLTGAVESEATTLTAIIQEMLLARSSERQGRMIDHDSAASMEKKKQEGYF